jgi:hypothetical protein
MGILIDYVALYARWIYAVCGLVALYQIYRLWNVRIERRQAVFSLEREKAARELQNIFSVAMLILLSMGVTYFTSNTLAQAVRPLVEEARAPNPTPGFIPTPTNTPLPATETPTITPTRLLTETAPTAATTLTETVPAGLPTETPTPAPPVVEAPPVAAPACADPRALITSPGNGQAVSGSLTIAGTASHDQFQYYKIEYAPAGTEGFNYLGGGNSPIANGALLTFDTGALGNGGWTLRLIVVDQTGNFPPPCQVTIQVQN